jgi:hypothetical protein
MMRRRNKGVKQIEEQAFRDGSQSVKPDAALNEVEAVFARRREQENHDATDRIKQLEAGIARLGHRQEELELHWLDLRDLTDGLPPQIILPLIAVTTASIVLFGEAIFLAPVMDGFGIADPIWQMVFAGVLVVVCSGLIHISKKNWPANLESDHKGRNEESKPRREGVGWVKFAGFGLLALFSLCLVSMLGWWRAEEMIFAASAQAGSWKEFLGNNPMLTRLVVVLLTTALPVFVAVAVDWGLDALRLAWDWRKTSWSLRRTTKHLENARKALEAQLEKKDARLHALEQQAKEWKNAYLQNHELGQRIGARQLPLARIVVKIAAVALLVLMSCLFLDPWLGGYIDSDSKRYLLYFCALLGIGGLYAYYALNSWDRPTARMLYRNKGVIFRNGEVTRREAGENLLSPPSERKNGQKEYSINPGRLLPNNDPLISQQENART